MKHCSHEFILIDKGWGRFPKSLFEKIMPTLIIMILCKHDFEYLDLQCIKCGELHTVKSEQVPNISFEVQQDNK